MSFTDEITHSLQMNTPKSRPTKDIGIITMSNLFEDELSKGFVPCKFETVYQAFDCPEEQKKSTRRHLGFFSTAEGARDAIEEKLQEKVKKGNMSTFHMTGLMDKINELIEPKTAIYEDPDNKRSIYIIFDGPVTINTDWEEKQLIRANALNKIKEANLLNEKEMEVLGLYNA